MKNRYYIFIHIKDLYSTAECLKRGFAPETKNLVVAKYERSNETKCLAVSPAMKRLGIRDDSRLSDIPKEIKYVIAEPSMIMYYKFSAAVYEILMRYVSKKSIAACLPYEFFADITEIIPEYKITSRELCQKLSEIIYKELKLCAICGIGTSLYLAKTAALFFAGETESNIAFLDSNLYKEKALNNIPLSGFWFINADDAVSFSKLGIANMADVLKADGGCVKKQMGRIWKTVFECAALSVPVTLKDIKENKLRVMDRAIFPTMKTRSFLNALSSAERILVPEIKFSAEALEEKDERISELKKGGLVTLVYYENGDYIKLCGTLCEIDMKKQNLTVVDKTLHFADIMRVYQTL